MSGERDLPQVLDLEFQGIEGTIASYLLWDGQEAALVETGPGSTVANLLSGLDSAGVPRESVTKLLLTHIHLDHAGAAGGLSRLLPNARVLVHERGARHLADPSRLVQSAARIYGEDMDRLWGEIVPVPSERLDVIADGDVLQAGGQELRVMYTPGHASHHVAFAHTSGAYVFTGDIAGVRLPGEERVLPPTPPPDLDLEAWERSIQQVRDLATDVLYLTHYGPVTDVGRHLTELQARLHSWRDLVFQSLHSGASIEQAAAELAEHAEQELGDPGARERYGLVACYAMNVAGFARYFKQLGLLPPT